MALEIVWRPRRAEPFQIVRAGEGALRQHCDPAADQRAVGGLSDPQDAVHALAHQVDESVALAEMQLDLRVFLQEPRQARHHEGPGQDAVHVHPQQPLGLGAGEGGLGLLDIGQDRQAALVIGLAVQSRADLPGGPLQQPHAQPRLQLLDPLGGGRARQAEILRRE
ncbi:hypothetical protein QFZ27_001157 [Inquilinus ginsengisoli]